MQKVKSKEEADERAKGTSAFFQEQASSLSEMFVDTYDKGTCCGLVPPRVTLC